MFNLYCVVFKRNIFSSKIGFKFLKLLANGQSNYKCYFEQIRDNVVYVRPCFVTLDGLNTKHSRVNPYV
jgi:hypothetical protein